MRAGSLRWSLSGRAAALAAIGVALGAGLTAAGVVVGIPPAAAGLAAVLFGLGVTAALAHRILAPLRRTLAALSDGVDSYRAGDYSVRLATSRISELADLVQVYNQLGEVMGHRRRDLRQRELLLASVLEANPTAVLLANPVGRILVANRAARRLFAGGGNLEGRSLDDVLPTAPRELAEALRVDAPGEALVGFAGDDTPEVYHVARQAFTLNARRHRLLLVRPVTQELRRQEVAVWKQVIRVVGHEINNALAPIRSLLASATKLLAAGDPGRRMPGILATIDESAARLHRFVDGYRRMARLPAPRMEPVVVKPFLEDLAELEGFDLAPVDADLVAVFDPAQIQQVLLNLVRNAVEAGSDGVWVSATLRNGQITLEVADRGPGLDPDTMVDAVLPFWTTKTEGSGLGLPLCREILELHGGSLHLATRHGGGLRVSCRLPAHQRSV